MAQALQSAQSKLALRLAPASPILEGQMALALPGVPASSTGVPQILSLVQEAMATGRGLTIRYARSEKSRLRSIELKPRHLSLRENGWLLLADDVAKGRSLTIRVERIMSAAVSERKGGRTRPGRRSKGAPFTATALRVKLRLHPPVSALVPAGDLPFGLQADERDGGIVLLLSHASGVRELLGWLLSFGPTVEVLEPVALRKELRRVAAELSALYHAET